MVFTDARVTVLVGAKWLEHAHRATLKPAREFTAKPRSGQSNGLSYIRSIV